MNLRNVAYRTHQMPFSADIYKSLTNPRNNEPKPKKEKTERIVFHGDRSKKHVALTFDADMTPQMRYDLQSGSVSSYYDQNLISILEETGTKATLFLSGMWIESYPQVARELAVNSLFELGNHTYSHPAFHNACYGLTQVQEQQKKAELEKTQKLLKDIVGYNNKLFRFPGGCYSHADLEVVSSTGQVAIHWDVAAQDGFNTDTTNIISNVVDNVQNGSIVVMHMNGYPNEPATANAIQLIISILSDRNYEFVTVSELLDFKKEKALDVKKILSLNIN
ncbi:MAG TPA: polysaccharide deacetylase family protein [Candidatus Limnocylindrales bacterium]|nr:polysaccharide deacetylase family protein [Candidatus Limnocylindrales bacterium]